MGLVGSSSDVWASARSASERRTDNTATNTPANASAAMRKLTTAKVTALKCDTPTAYRGRSVRPEISRTIKVFWATSLL